MSKLTRLGLSYYNLSKVTRIEVKKYNPSLYGRVIKGEKTQFNVKVYGLHGIQYSSTLSFGGSYENYNLWTFDSEENAYSWIRICFKDYLEDEDQQVISSLS